MGKKKAKKPAKKPAKPAAAKPKRRRAKTNITVFARESLKDSGGVAVTALQAVNDGFPSVRDAEKWILEAGAKLGDPPPIFRIGLMHDPIQLKVEPIIKVKLVPAGLADDTSTEPAPKEPVPTDVV